MYDNANVVIKIRERKLCIMKRKNGFRSSNRTRTIYFVKGRPGWIRNGYEWGHMGVEEAL